MSYWNGQQNGECSVVSAGKVRITGDNFRKQREVRIEKQEVPERYENRIDPDGYIKQEIFKILS